MNDSNINKQNEIPNKTKGKRYVASNNVFYTSFMQLKGQCIDIEAMQSHMFSEPVKSYIT